MLSSVGQRFQSSRGAAIALGVGAAVLAGVLLLLYLNSYRNSVAGETAPTSVLVARSLIPAGTSGTLIGEKDLYQTATLPADEVKVGALADPAYINGRVTAADILPGQQFTTADFSTTTTEAISTKLTGLQRGISVSVDNVHGSLSELRAGDRIDLYVSLGATGNGQALVKLFRPNVLVMSVPANETSEVSGTRTSGNLVLRINERDAADFAYAADNTQFYFVLRPAAGAKPTKPDTATIDSILRGR